MTTKEPANQGHPAGAAAPAGALLSILQAVIDLQTHEAISIVDRSLRLIAFNAAWKSSMRLGDEVAGRTVEELFDFMDARIIKDTRAMFEPVLMGETIIRSLGALEDGQISQVLLSPWRDGSGEVGGVICRHQQGSGDNIGLRTQERRLRLAMETAKVTAFEIDFRTGVIVNDPPARGGLVSHPVGLNSLSEKLSTSSNDDAQTALARHLETGEPIRGEFQVADGSGGHVWRRSVSEVVYDQDHKVVGMVGVSQDIDDYKQAQLALIAEKEAAQAADRAKSEFLANISHEIRTPLNGVLGLASVLAKTSLDLTQRQMVFTIEASAKTLNSLMSDVLDLAKIESGRLELDPRPFAPAEAVQHIHYLFAAAAAEKGLDLSCEIDPSAKGMAIGDQPRLSQILTNLTSNAIKFTTCGAVSLGVRAEGEGEDQRLVFTVSDTGMGISKEALPRLFERFVQADGSINRSYGGTGLGLAISRQLARLMDGDIIVTSAPDQGSTFSLTVRAPRSLLDVTATASEDAGIGAGLPPGRRLRVLLVEDHPVNRRVVELILGDVVSLDFAEDGALGLAAFRSSPFDVVLMDMQMPVMDGLEATRAIRAFERAARADRTPIIMLSANALNEHVRSGLEAGADFFLAKPFTADELVQAVVRAVEISDSAVSFLPVALA